MTDEQIAAVLNEMPPPVIGAGDWVKSTLIGLCMGEVIEVGGVPFGKRHIEGFHIRRPDGMQDFIPAEDAVLLGGMARNQQDWLQNHFAAQVAA